MFERYGVIEAEDPDEAVAIAGVVLSCPLPKGRRVGIVVTVSGGGGAWTADTMSAHGLIVPQLSAAEQARLRPLMPSYGAAGNPVDVTAQGSNTGPAMMTAMEHLAESDEIDMLLLVSSLASTTRASLDAARIRAVAAKCGKPMTVWTYTLPSEFGRNAASGCGLFLHSDLRACGLAFGKLADYAEAMARPLPEAFDPVPARLEPGLPKMPVPEFQAKQALAAWLPPAAERLVVSAEAAAGDKPRAALGFPVVPESAIGRPAAHKTGQAGGDAAEPARRPRTRVAHRLHRDAGRRRRGVQPDAKIDGVLVQKMAPKGHELVIGMVNDPTFGPIMMVGYGGTTVELFGDVVHAPAPIDEAEATRMILALKSARLLTGFRWLRRRIDLDAGSAKLVGGACPAAALTLREQVAEFELNPVILHADDSGLTVADALLTLRVTAGAGQHPHVLTAATS